MLLKCDKVQTGGKTVKNQNIIHEEIKNILNSGSSYYHPVQNHLSYLVLSKNSKMKI